MPTPDLHVELSAAAAAELRDLMPAMRLLKDEAQVGVRSGVRVGVRVRVGVGVRVRVRVRVWP